MDKVMKRRSWNPSCGRRYSGPTEFQNRFQSSLYNHNKPKFILCLPCNLIVKLFKKNTSQISVSQYVPYSLGVPLNSLTSFSSNLKVVGIGFLYSTFPTTTLTLLSHNSSLKNNPHVGRASVQDVTLGPLVSDTGV